MKKEGFKIYEYMELDVKESQASFYIDCYRAFGWLRDENMVPGDSTGKAVVRLKRDRKIVNRTELTRLQRHFEADMAEIDALENSKTKMAEIMSITTGVIGTAFMTGSVFAVTAEPPVIWLCVMLAVPAMCGWITPYFIYRRIKAEKIKCITPYIDSKYDEICEICEKGYSLL